MLQMMRHINQDWKTHVAETGVVCYTCHRGNPVPANIWFENPGWPQPAGSLRRTTASAIPNAANGSTEPAAGSLFAVP